MVEKIKLTSTIRKEIGKGVARRLRKKGMLPAVIYGHNTPSTPLTIESKHLKNVIGGRKSEHKLLGLSIEGNGEPTEKIVMIKELQIDPVKRNYLHVDFFEVAMDEEITIPVPIKLIGEAKGVEIGGVLQQVQRELEIKCLPSQIPDSLEIDVSLLNIGDSIHLKDVQLPPGIRVLEDADLTIATVLAPTVEKEVVEEVVEEKVEEAALAMEDEGKKVEEEKKEAEEEKGKKD